MGKMVLLVVLVVLALGGGAGGYFMFGGSQDQAEAAEMTAPAEPAFMALEPMTLPVLRGKRVRTMVALRIVLELAPGYTLFDFTDRIPRIEDAFVTELAALLAVEWPSGEPLDVAFAKSRLLQESDRVMGRKVVSRILIENFQVRHL